MTDIDRHFARSAAADVAKFLARQASWLRMVSAHQLDPSNPYSVRQMPSKNAKYEAYSRGGTLARLLGEPTPQSCADLGRLVGLAFGI